MNHEVLQLVFIEVQDGKSQEQIDAYNALVPQVLAESGCIQYDLTKVDGTTNSFILIEKWSSKEALAAHDASPHMVIADARNMNFRAKQAKVVKLIHPTS
jgi:quinol monooxygenase YgiN